MKTFLKVISWIGVGIVSLGVIIAFIQSWTMTFPEPGFLGGVNWGHPFALLLAIIGLPLMLVGGLIAKPRHFWLVSIIVSSLYIVSFFPVVPELVHQVRSGQLAWRISHGTWVGFLLQLVGAPLILGLVGISEGIFIKRIEARSKAKQQRAETSNQQKLDSEN